MKIFVRLLVALVSASGMLCLFSCCAIAPPAAPKALTLMTWNTQNLFDDQKNGNEYPEFVPGGSSGWNRDEYRKRLSRAAGVIRDGAGLPDVVVLQEIETSKVIDDLCNDFLPAGSYPFHMVQDDEGPIHVALLSRFPIGASRSHRIWLNGSSARSVWELHVAIEGGPALVIMANHWKSKNGGEAETEALRILAARTIRDRAALLRQENPSIDIVVCGDLNEIIHETIETPPTAARGRHLGRISAGDRRAAMLRPEALVALGRRPEHGVKKDESYKAALWVQGIAEKTEENDCWISPWTGTGRDASGTPGSYFWQGNWEAIDHFLLSPSLFDAEGWNYATFRVINGPGLLNESGSPQRYDQRKGEGVSDHLPLLLGLSSATS